MPRRWTYVADAPGNGALFARSRSLVGLALDAEVHDVVTADGAVVDYNVPSPESYSVPLRSVNHQPVLLEPYATTHLLDFEALLVARVCAGAGLGDLCLGRGRICHINVRHGVCGCGGCGEAAELRGGWWRRLQAVYAGVVCWATDEVACSFVWQWRTEGGRGCLPGCCSFTSSGRQQWVVPGSSV